MSYVVRFSVAVCLPWAWSVVYVRVQLGAVVLPWSMVSADSEYACSVAAFRLPCGLVQLRLFGRVATWHGFVKLSGLGA
eukprot:10064712-Heterocapsa_arctica.AAC.1